MGWRPARLVSLMAFAVVTDAAAAPADSPKTGAQLFVGHCQTCHSLNPADPPRQGPNLAGVYGRKAGSLAHFPYSKGFATADFSWDDDHLDGWLAGPQNVIAGTYMLYHQPDPTIRKKIVDFLKSGAK